MFLNNPAYTLAKKVDKYRIYTPANETEYHMSRHVEASRQSIYASSGANAEVIQAHLQAILDRCNQAQSFDNFKTDITSLANALMYRTKYPVDQHCGVRMGCILSFIEYDEAGVTIFEDPQKTELPWLQLKEKLAFQYPDLYTFFLTWGISNVRQWSDHLGVLEDREYFLNRMNTIRSLLPSNLLSQLTQ